MLLGIFFQMTFYPYQQLAFFYDQVYSNDFYTGYSFFIQKIIIEHNVKNPHILDIACGTGTLLQKLRHLYLTVEGSDMSKEMLTVAKKKNNNIKYYNQSFIDLNIRKKYDVVVCTFDSINYITSKKDLIKTFKNVGNHLVEGGFFIFDFNTIYKKLPDFIIKDNITYNNKLKGRYWDVCIQIKKGSKLYEENHRERLYSFREMRKTLIENNFKIVSIYTTFKEKVEYVRKSNRLFIVAQKVILQKNVRHNNYITKMR